MEKKNVIRLIFSPLVVKHIICARRMKWEKNKERSESTKLDSISDSHPASVYISIPRVILLAHKQKKTIDFFFHFEKLPVSCLHIIGGRSIMNIWFLRRVLLTFEQCFSKKARLTVSLGKKKSSKQFRSKIVVLEFLINCQSLNTPRDHNLKEKFWLWLFIFLIQFIQNFQLRQCRQKKNFSASNLFENRNNLLEGFHHGCPFSLQQFLEEKKSLL